jgi:hypothetical protein
VATFLALCNQVVTRSGVIGAALTSVATTSARQAKCVDWVAHSWELIQSLQDWDFLKAEVPAVALTIGTASYSGAALGISTRFDKFRGERPGRNGIYRPWTIYDNAIGVSDEMPLQQIGYPTWREMYDRSTQVNNRPVHYAFAPDGTIRFGPIPNKQYMVRGEYLKAPQILAADADVPDMPSKFHPIIVWRAIMLASEHDEAPMGLNGAVSQFQQLLIDMEAEFLPEMDPYAAGPLA